MTENLKSIGESPTFKALGLNSAWVGKRALEYLVSGEDSPVSRHFEGVLIDSTDCDAIADFLGLKRGKVNVTDFLKNSILFCSDN